MRNVHIPIFSSDESILFLKKYFAEEDSSEFLEGFDYATIAYYSGNNPKALNNAVKDKIDVVDSITKEKFLFTLNASEIREEIELDEIIHGRIEGLDKRTKVILEAVSLFPTTFRFQSVYDLLNIEKVHTFLFQESIESIQ